MPGAVRVVVIPGDEAGGGAPVPVVVCARTGHPIRALAAIMVPSEACLAILNVSLWDKHPTIGSFRGCARFGHKRTCGLRTRRCARAPLDSLLSGRDPWQSDRFGGDICGSLW